MRCFLVFVAHNNKKRAPNYFFFLLLTLNRYLKILTVILVKIYWLPKFP